MKQALADLVNNLSGTTAKIVGMIHDEIIVETHRSEALQTAVCLPLFSDARFLLSDMIISKS